MEQTRERKLNPIIAKLAQLQQLDSEIFKHQCVAREKPQQLAFKQAEIAQWQASLNEFAAKNKEYRKKTDLLELDLQERQEKINKLNLQLNTLKSNKDYQTMKHEIEAIEADNSIIEDTILKSMADMDAQIKKIESTRTKLTELEKDLCELKTQVDTELKVVESHITQLNAQRTEMIRDIDPEALATYERILNNKGDKIAIIQVNDESCGACYMNMTTQELNILMKNKELVLCKSCSRILYI